MQRWRERATWVVSRSRDSIREEGVVAFARRAQDFTASRIRERRGTSPTLLSREAVSVPSSFRSILVLCGPAPRQCLRYRVTARPELAVGWPGQVLVADVSRPDEARRLLQLVAVLIVFRLADSPALRGIVDEARRLGVPVVFESDDLVHRRDAVEANPNLATVTPSLRRAVISGADGYRAALRMCDHAIGSTSQLTDELGREVPGRSWTIANGIDRATELAANGIAIERAGGRLPRHAGRRAIAYGSGSLAHDADLGLIGDALAEVMARHGDIDLWLMGTVSVPGALAAHADRVLRIAELPYGEYLRHLAAADVSIAPLLDEPFNHYKSNVKFLESAMVGTPLVASRVVYGETVTDGTDALLATTTEEWIDSLSAVLSDASMGERLAANARSTAASYLLSDPDSIPRRQFATVMESLVDRGIRS